MDLIRTPTAAPGDWQAGNFRRNITSAWPGVMCLTNRLGNEMFTKVFHVYADVLPDF